MGETSGVTLTEVRSFVIDHSWCKYVSNIYCYRCISPLVAAFSALPIRKLQPTLKSEDTTPTPRVFSPVVIAAPRVKSTEPDLTIAKKPLSLSHRVVSMSEQHLEEQQESTAAMLYDQEQEMGDRRRRKRRSVGARQTLAQLDRLENSDASFDTVFSYGPSVGSNQLNLMDSAMAGVTFNVLPNKDQGGTLFLMAQLNVSVVVRIYRK